MMDNKEDDYDDAADNESVYWECESTAPGSTNTDGAETWYESEWDSNWDEGAEGEAYYDYDENGSPVYYEDEGED